MLCPLVPLPDYQLPMQKIEGSYKGIAVLTVTKSQRTIKSAQLSASNFTENSLLLDPAMNNGLIMNTK